MFLPLLEIFLLLNAVLFFPSDFPMQTIITRDNVELKIHPMILFKIVVHLIPLVPLSFLLCSLLFAHRDIATYCLHLICCLYCTRTPCEWCIKYTTGTIAWRSSCRPHSAPLWATWFVFLFFSAFSPSFASLSLSLSLSLSSLSLSEHLTYVLWIFFGFYGSFSYLSFHFILLSFIHPLQ